jgi:hypothetical protein
MGIPSDPGRVIHYGATGDFAASVGMGSHRYYPVAKEACE